VNNELPNQSQRDDARGKGAGKAAEDARDTGSGPDAQSLQSAKSVDPKARHHEQKSGAVVPDPGAGNQSHLTADLADAARADSTASKLPGAAASTAPELSALDVLDEKLSADTRSVQAPRIGSFKEFLLKHARVPIGGGEYGPFTFEGREALIEIVDKIDEILGNGGSPEQVRQVLKDSELVIAGGAQFGKTILEQNLAAYLTGVRFLNVGVYLPDDNLASGIVDAKFRPDVVDQIPWFAKMTQVGKSVNKSGKAVNTKGAFLVTDGERKAVGMYRGLRKVPTSFSNDVVVRDEEDDIPRDKAKFLSGRLTASALRFQIIVGTQRIHGAGQNKKWEEGSQGVMLVGPYGGEAYLNPEEQWPQICRMQLGDTPSTDDPKLTYDGDFKRDGSHEVAGTYVPDGTFYLADPETGEPLNRHHVVWKHRRPERIKLRKFSYRISQLGIPAIDLAQIVAHWTRAVADGEEMISFCCDRLARPKSAAQALTPAILDRARGVDPYDFGVINEGFPRFGGLDTGDRCWLVTREKRETHRRIVRVDKIAAGDVVARSRSLFESQQMSALFIDERPLVNEARTLALALNGLEGIEFPDVDWDNKELYITLPGGLTWDGRKREWLNLRCAVVRFTKNKLGAGVSQIVVTFEEDGQKKVVPGIECNRFETIDRVVREFLTPAENVIEVIDGKVRQTPAMLLPRRVPGAPAVLETLDAHLLAGSQREKDKIGELGDYLDGIENHFLLGDGYSALSEMIGGSSKAAPAVLVALPLERPNMEAATAMKGGLPF
jgi:hypothetical protein